MFLSTRFARRAGFLLAATGFVTALAGAAGSPANADNGLPTPDANVIYRLTTPNSLGLAVANDSMADDAPVVQNALDVFALSQDWSFLPQAGGSYEMINLNSGKCLSVYGNSTAPGTGLVQYACHGWADQQWKLMRGANGDIQSWVSVSSGLAMDVPGSSPRQGLQLQQWPYNGNDRLASQHFDVKVVAHTIDQTKTYRITTANSLAFDVTNSSQNNDAPVIQWGVNGGQNQNWLVRQVPGSRYFQIINLNSPSA
jgi:hypothetical protein